MDNLISAFDETKLTIEQEEENEETVWYDITDVIKGQLEGKKSILEYAKKIEMELFTFYSKLNYGDDKMETIRDKYEKIVAEDEFDRFMCVSWDDTLSVYNDARNIRVTFKNGSTLTATNSEWGGIYLQ